MKNKKLLLIPLVILLAGLVYVFVLKGRLSSGGGDVTRVTETTTARSEREEKRKAEYKEFYVPLKPLDNPYIPTRKTVKGLYMKAHVAGSKFRTSQVSGYADYVKRLIGEKKGAVDEAIENETTTIEKMLGIIEATEVNALVIDIKEDGGYVTWPTDIKGVADIQREHPLDFEYYEPLLQYCKEKGIYTIARIVAFKDPYLAEKFPEHAMQLKTGGLYRDGSGTPWVNPFDHFVWEYVVSIAKEAALRGFDEINFDYVRFPDNAAVYNETADFPGRDGKRKDKNIEDFLIYAGKELTPYDVFLSADVFGIVTQSWDDSDDIGQTWRKISRVVDVICPMIYPSHYGTGWYGFDVPDQEPYDVTRAALREAIEKNASQEHVPVIRPWIQGFTATWVQGYKEYTPEVIADQIIAAHELGIEEYLVWNAENVYDPMTFVYQDRIHKVDTDTQDLLGRTAQEALEMYLMAQKKQKTKEEYLLTPPALRTSEFDDFDRYIREVTNRKLFEYGIDEIRERDGGGYEAEVSGLYNSLLGVHEMDHEQFLILKEHGVWKIYQDFIRFEDREVPVGN